MRRVAALALAASLLAAACSSDDDDDATATTDGSTDTTAAGSGTTTGDQPAEFEDARGFDGETLLVGGIGSANNFTGADAGALARFKRANDTDELPYDIEYVGFADDRQDPATATSEARRLVTQEHIFAVVPDFSAVNPGEYWESEQVPYVGYAFDNTYCSQEPSTEVWGFGYSGCLVPADPLVMNGNYMPLYTYVTETKGVEDPSIVLFSNDNESGKNSAHNQRFAAEGAGFEVVYAEGVVPLQATDYTPYVQEWLTADDGGQPDAMYCLLSIQCLGIWEAVKAAGFEGTFQTSLYVEQLLGPLAGTVALNGWNAESNPGLDQMVADLTAFDPEATVSTLTAASYFAADMFIQALKTVGTDVTPEAVQQALANQTWQIEGFAGPTIYPDSSVTSTPFCGMLLENADGTEWTPVVPFECYEEQFPVE